MSWRPNLFVIVILIIFSGCAASTSPSQTSFSGTDFLVSEVGEQFVIRLVKPEQIALARARINGTKPQGIVSGVVVDGDGGFNRDVAANKKWTWHLDPASITFPQLAMELCDGKPSDVEHNKDHWIKDIKRYCPWAAKIVRELPSGNDAGGTWRYHQDFAKGAGWDAKIDGCDVKWCGGKDWDSKVGCEGNGSMRLLKEGDQSIVFVHFANHNFTQATIRLKYFHLQLDGDLPNAAGSKLQARTAADPDPSCDTAEKGTYKPLKELNGTSPVKPKPDCTEEEATVVLAPKDQVIYWKFLKGSYRRAMILDDVTIELSGNRSQTTSPSDNR